MRRFFFSLLIAVVASSALVAEAKEPRKEVLGATYPIAERDLQEEFMERIAQVDWKKVFDPQKAEEKLLNWRPKDVDHIRPAKKDSVRLETLISVVPYDLYDVDGNIIYPAGYSFNTLDYVSLPNILVFLDGGSAQTKWFKNTPYHADQRTMVILTGGSLADAQNFLGLPVYYASRLLVDTFKIQATPTVAFQEGNQMKLHEFEVKEKKDVPKKR